MTSFEKITETPEALAVPGGAYGKTKNLYSQADKAVVK